MRMPMKARYSVSLKTLLAVVGVSLLAACSGNPTAPATAPKAADRASTLVPGTRNNSGYVVAERDSSSARLTAGTFGPKQPADSTALSLSW